MALYQCTYFIVPKTGNYNLFPGLNLDTFKDDVFFEDHYFWDESELNISKMLEYLEGEIDEGESWSDDLKIYGDNDHNCINVLIEDNKISSISLRLDFTLDYSLFLHKAIDFCKIFKFLIVDSDLNILNLDFYEIKKNIETSENFSKFRNLGNTDGGSLYLSNQK